MPASYDSRLLTITPTANGYETRASAGADQRIGIYTLLGGVIAVIVGLFLPTVLLAIVVALGVLFTLVGVSILVQAARAKPRELTVLNATAGTVTQGSTVVPRADISGIGLIPIRSFKVVAVHRTAGKPLWLSAAAKMPRQDELVAAVADMAAAMNVPHIEPATPAP